MRRSTRPRKKASTIPNQSGDNNDADTELPASKKKTSSTTTLKRKSTRKAKHVSVTKTSSSTSQGVHVGVESAPEVNQGDTDVDAGATVGSSCKDARSAGCIGDARSTSCVPCPIADALLTYTSSILLTGTENVINKMGCLVRAWANQQGKGEPTSLLTRNKDLEDSAVGGQLDEKFLDNFRRNHLASLALYLAHEREHALLIAHMARSYPFEKLIPRLQLDATRTHHQRTVEEGSGSSTGEGLLYEWQRIIQALRAPEGLESRVAELSASLDARWPSSYVAFTWTGVCAALSDRGGFGHLLPSLLLHFVNQEPALCYYLCTLLRLSWRQVLTRWNLNSIAGVARIEIPDIDTFLKAIEHIRTPPSPDEMREVVIKAAREGLRQPEPTWGGVPLTVWQSPEVQIWAGNRSRYVMEALGFFAPPIQLLASILRRSSDDDEDHQCYNLATRQSTPFPPLVDTPADGICAPMAAACVASSMRTLGVANAAACAAAGSSCIGDARSTSCAPVATVYLDPHSEALTLLQPEERSSAVLDGRGASCYALSLLPGWVSQRGFFAFGSALYHYVYRLDYDSSKHGIGEEDTRYLHNIYEAPLRLSTPFSTLSALAGVNVWWQKLRMFDRGCSPPRLYRPALQPLLDPDVKQRMEGVPLHLHPFRALPSDQWKREKEHEKNDTKRIYIAADAFTEWNVWLRVHYIGYCGVQACHKNMWRLEFNG